MLFVLAITRLEAESGKIEGHWFLSWMTGLWRQAASYRVWISKELHRDLQIEIELVWRSNAKPYFECLHKLAVKQILLIDI